MPSCMPSEIFWSTFVGIVAGLIISMTNQFFKSKCKEVSCCCLKIVRDIEAETELELNNPIQSQPSPNTPRSNARLNI